MAIRDSIVGAVQSGQMAVGSALTGGGAAIAGSGSGAVPLLEDLRGISRENEGNTERLTNVLKEMFAFDKTRFQRDRDQQREEAKEALAAPTGGGGGGGLPSMEEMTGGFGAKGIAAIAALAFFAKGMGVNTDILKLPQQLKSIKSMATFAKGIGTIGTLGFGPRIVKDIKLVLDQFGGNFMKMFTKNIGNPLNARFVKIADDIKAGPLGGIAKSLSTNVFQPMRNFFSVGKGGGPFKGIISLFDDAKVALLRVVKPIKGFFTGMTGAGGLFNAVDGPLASILKPIKAIGKTIGKLFLPLTIILGIFDGVSGFMKEYEETGSIVDGIRGAVVGIVDGFIGTFVRLITDLVGMALSFLGLDNLGSFVMEFGEKITGFFSDAVGGIVDIITGIFTLDFDRILGGFGSLFSGVGNFFLTVLTAPINMAVNFIKDIFGFGDPDKPFSLIDWFLGEDGIVMGAWNWFKGLFSFDFGALKQKLFDMGAIFKGLAMGGIAAAKAILPGGESPGEAFKRVFDSYTKGNEVSTDVESGSEISKLTTEDIQGNTTEATYKTNTIDNSSNNNQAAIIYNDQSTKQVSNSNSMKSETYTGSLNVNIDPYFDRYLYNQTA